MPLSKYQLHGKSFQDSVNLNLSSSIAIETQPVASEKNSKRQRVESCEEIIPLKSTITYSVSSKHIEEQPQKKKTKTKTIDEPVVQPTVIQPPPEPPLVQPTLPLLSESVTEKESVSEAPFSFPSTNGRMRELKSKTPAWKAQKPVAKGDTQGNSLYSQ